MFFRKFYLKSRLYLYSKREFFYKVFFITVLTCLSYYFLNYIVFDTIILGKANYDKMNNNCPSAISLYKTAYAYYGINHFSQQNQQIYYRIPYEISLCYLKEKNPKKAYESILEGVTNLQNRYGIYSPQTAYFIRRYLTDYYLLNNNPKQARQEFKGLIVIYKKIGYDNNIMSDLIRLLGDIYYQQGFYDEAMTYYEKAYNAISVQTHIDYEIYARIVNRICDYEVKNNKYDEAITIYRRGIDFLKASGEKQNELTADMMLRLFDLYQKTDVPSKTSMQLYEEAVYMIKGLPRTTYLKQNIRQNLIKLKELYEQNNEFAKAQKIDDELSKQRRLNWFY